MLKRMSLAVVILASLASAWGQRVVNSVQPSETDPLVFDINEVPLTNLPLAQTNDLNFSPNVVFTLDSARAFVSYPGSAAVVAFDTASAEILAVIPVGANPSLLTMTPDGSKVAVVSLFLQANLPDTETNFEGERIGSISIIDTQTYEARTLQLQEVFFSFANNIVFSADGQTGFVASAGTDQLLRFDVETATEISPRLQFEGGTRPTNITMAPDSSFYTLVLVGSSFLPELETPDSIQIVDPESFRVIRSIVPEPAEVMRTDGSIVRIPHRFFATNNVAISRDGRFGVIADQENSFGAPIRELSADHALLLDLEAGEVLAILTIGGAGGISVAHPDREQFIVLSAVGLTFVFPETEQGLNFIGVQSLFRPTSRPAFSADGNSIFVASPVLDQVRTYDTRTGALRNLVPVGLDFESEVEGVTAGAQHMQLSPNGQVLALVNFNANNLELLRNTRRVAIPELLSTTGLFTGVALTNTGTEVAEIVAGGVSTTGLPFFDDPETEEEVEFVNPRVIELQAGEQMAFTAAELLQAAPGQTIQGWLDLDTDQTSIAGFFLTGDRQVRRLDGGVILVDLPQASIVPGVEFRDGFQMELTVLNSNLSGISTDVTLADSAGEVVEQVTQVVNAGAVFRNFLIDPDPDDDTTEGLFDPDLLTEGETYYLVVSASQGTFAYLRSFDAERMAAISGFPVLGPDAEVFDRLLVPQVVTFGGTETRVHLVNLSAETANLSLRLRDADGMELAAPVEFELESGHSRSEELAELFQLAEQGAPVQGWLEAVSDQEGLVGSVEIQLFSGRAMTAFPMLGTAADRLVFAHVAEGSGFSTGIALLNSGSEPATATVTVHAAGGEVVGTQDVALQPGQRISQLLRDLVGPLPVLDGGYVLVVSDQPLQGLELFYTDDQEVLAVVPAQSPELN